MAQKRSQSYLEAFSLQRAAEETVAKERARIKDPLERIISLQDLVDATSPFTLYDRSDRYARSLSLALSRLLIDDQGKLDFEILDRAIKLIDANLYSLDYPLYDNAQRHVATMLKKISESKTLALELTQVSHHLAGRHIGQLVRQTIELDEREKIREVDVKRAALASLLYYFRQKVGSCFATAPAMLVQELHPEQFLKEIKELLTRGHLSRMIDGSEESAPALLEPWLGDLYRPFWVVLDRDKKRISHAHGLVDALLLGGLSGKDEAVLLLEKALESFQSHLFITTVSELLYKVFALHFQMSKRELEELLGSASLKKENFIKAYHKSQASFSSLTENSLLRCWEYTIASFAESKGAFMGWNLFTSLGFDPNEKGGLGELLKQILESRLEKIEAKIEALNIELENLGAEAAFLEGRVLEDSYSQSAYYIKHLELRRVMEERDLEYEQGRKIASLLNFMVDFYTKRFKEYFQEIYDPSLGRMEGHSLVNERFTDSPAGFRLIYKHGRRDPQLWTAIRSSKECADALAAFFVASEPELSHSGEARGHESLIAELVTQLISRVRSEEFMKGAELRLEAKARESKRQKITPWSYISGGDLHSLVASYFKLSLSPERAEARPNSCQELALFFIGLKGCAKNGPLLAYSPRHAFLFKPDLMEVPGDGQGAKWLDEKVIVPSVNFFSKLLSQHEIDFLLEKIERKIVPEGYRPLFRRIAMRVTSTLSLIDFRRELIRALSYERWMQENGYGLHFTSELDGLLYRLSPLMTGEDLRASFSTILEAVEGVSDLDKKGLERAFAEKERELLGTMLSRAKVQKIFRALFLKQFERRKCSFDLVSNIFRALEKVNLAPPRPLVFADSNWSHTNLAFVVGPSGALEIWGCGSDGEPSRPLHEWQQDYDGSQTAPWGVYVGRQSSQKALWRG